jgi:hypothetical protein
LGEEGERLEGAFMPPRYGSEANTVEATRAGTHSTLCRYTGHSPVQPAFFGHLPRIVTGVPGSTQ